MTGGLVSDEPEAAIANSLIELKKQIRSLEKRKTKLATQRVPAVKGGASPNEYQSILSRYEDISQQLESFRDVHKHYETLLKSYERLRQNRGEQQKKLDISSKRNAALFYGVYLINLLRFITVIVVLCYLFREWSEDAGFYMLVSALSCIFLTFIHTIWCDCRDFHVGIPTWADLCGIIWVWIVPVLEKLNMK